MLIYLNDRIVAEQEALVSVFDHGFLYGDGIYETMRAYDGKVFMIERHIERLGRSADLIRLDIPEAEAIRDAVHGTMAANGLSNAYIRITISRGKGPIGLDPALCPTPTFVVIAEQFKEYPEVYYTDGLKLIIAETRRNSIAAINPKIKSLNFLNNILAKLEAKDRGAYEAIMLNSEGFIAEGTISNIFFIKDRVLCTPSKDAGILDGITRDTVISVAREDGMSVNEGLFYPDELLRSSEVFFTNTSGEVMPVSQVEEITYKVGDTTKRLHKLYKARVEEKTRER